MFFFQTGSEKERKNSEDILTIPESEPIAGINTYMFWLRVPKKNNNCLYLELGGDCYKLSHTRNKTNIIKAIEYVLEALDCAKTGAKTGFV